MIELSKDDVTATIDLETAQLISKLILAWARFDSLVSHWTIHAFGMNSGAGAILLGNMDTRTKLERLKKLHKHYDVGEAVTFVKNLMTELGKHVDVRNAITHKACGGHYKADPDRLIFSNIMPFEQKIGTMQIELVHLDQIRAATDFAAAAGDQVGSIIDRLLAQLEELQRQSGETLNTSPPNP